MRQVDSVQADTAGAVKCDLASEVLRSYGSLRFAAMGWSMLPAIWPGDTLVVERASADQLQVGEVALVGREGRLCAHRVVSGARASGNPNLITQGDAMPAPDRPVAGGEVLGRVAYIIRSGKCVSVPTKLNLVEQLVAKIVRRSFLAGRAFVYLHRMVGNGREFWSKGIDSSVPGLAAQVERYSVVIAIGGVAVRLNTADADFLAMLEERYTGFVLAETSAEAARTQARNSISMWSWRHRNLLIPMRM